MKRLCILIAVIALPHIAVAQQTVGFRIDHVECSLDLCKELDPTISKKTTSFSFDEIRAHFLREHDRIAMGGSVYARPKISYHFGETIPLDLAPYHKSNRTSSSAWPSRYPLSCSLVARKGIGKTVRVRLQNDETTKRPIDTEVQSGTTIAFVVKGRDRTMQLLLACPFIHEAEPSDAPKDRASRFDIGKHNAGPR